MKTILRFLVRNILLPNAKMLKRVANIETPIYKLWWKWNLDKTQKELDKLHGVNFAERY